MSRIKFILYFLLVTIMYACEDKDVMVESQNIEVTAKILSSRTAYSSDNGITNVSWVTGDEIGLFSPNKNNIRYIAENSSENSSFKAFDNSLLAKEGDSIFAYYPYSYGFRNNKIVLPATSIQRYGDIGYNHGNILSETDLMIAKGKVEDGRVNLQFEHFHAFLKITLPLNLLDTTEERFGVAIESTEKICAINSVCSYDIKSETIDSINSFVSNRIVYYMDGVDTTKDEVTFYVAIFPQTENARISIKKAHYNSNFGFEDLLLYNKKAPKGGFQAGNVYTLRFGSEDMEWEYEKIRNALIAIYNATDGDNWKNNTNWCSDKPLDTWYGVHTLFPLDLGLGYNGLYGTLPKEVAILMDDARFMTFGDNGLHGKIPKEILNHPNWSKWGWEFIAQSLWLGGGFDFSEGVNLKTKDDNVSLFLKNSVTTVYDILKKNELTIVSRFIPLDEMGFPNGFVNLFLDYHNKGLGFVNVFSKYYDYSTSDFNNYIQRQLEYGFPEKITWVHGEFGNMSHGANDVMIFDKEGNLLNFLGGDLAIPSEWYVDQLKVMLKNKLGEPEEHPKYPQYCSTDYSMDGEVITLQKATIGQGIDLVFLGDGFVDKDMNSGGYYERTMQLAMENLFAYEPYQSLRNRFNVYAIKAVSATLVYDEQKPEDKAFWQKSDSYIFDYATKVPDINKEQLHVALIPRPNAIYEQSYCQMYSDGSFIALLYEIENVINHEVGGHGFGNLFDEYVGFAMENSILSEEEQTYLDNVWNDFGWGANVDWRNDASTVKWSHFLNDSRYANEGLGLYEGAYLYGHGAYRSTENSMMRYNDSPFNAPSREQIYKRIMQLSEGDDWKYDYEEFVKFDENSRNAASRSAEKLKTEAERKEYLKNHRPPTYIKGSWRDAMKTGNRNVVIPLRW